MRHTSQATIIEKLHKLIATIEALPEGTALFMAESWLHSENELFLEGESFAELFAGQEVTSQGVTVFKIVDGCRFKGSHASIPDGPYTMPELDSYDPSRSKAVAEMHAEMDRQEEEA